MGFKKRVTAVFLAAVLAISPAWAVAAQPADVRGHWAESEISAWMAAGLVKGYPDGRFQPDQEITRAELVSLINRASGYTEGAVVDFRDVGQTDWHYREIGRAVAAGYISGYPDGTFQPGSPVTRQEAAVIIARLMRMDAYAGNLEFRDAGETAGWSRGAVGAAAAAGYLKGYPDQTFRPAGIITRAEAVAILERSIGIRAVIIEEAGTYGPAAGIQTISGSVTIGAPGVVLQNMVITGSLLLDEGIGEGEVVLRRVTVQGETEVRGGGRRSVALQDCTLAGMTVSREGVRITALGRTGIETALLETGAALVEDGVSGSGFETVVVSEQVAAGSVILLAGDFRRVVISAEGVQVVLAGGTVTELEITPEAEGAVVELYPDTRVGTLILDAAAEVRGEGRTGTARVNAPGSILEQRPERLELAVGVTVKVEGRIVDEGYAGYSIPAGGGGGGAGGGGGGGGGGGTVMSIAIAGSIAEGSEEGGQIRVTLSGGRFASVLALENWTVANLPAGVTVREVHRDSPTRARLRLQGSAGDFDSDITGVTVSCGVEEYQDNEGGGELSDLDGGFRFIAAEEDQADISVEWGNPPGTGGEKESMDGEVIRVRISGGFFVQDRIDGISLEGTAVDEAGISKEFAVWVDAGTVDIHLKWDGSDYGSDKVLVVKVPADAYVDSNGGAISGEIICSAG